MRYVSKLASLCFEHKAFLVVLGMQALLLNFFYIGPGFNDDYQYIDYAAQIAAHGTLSHAPMAVRNALVLPLAGAFAIFGINDVAIRVTSTLWAAFALLITYLLGRQVYGKLAGLLASVFFIFFPLIFQYATQIVADIPAAACSGLAILLFLKGGIFKPDDRRASMWYFLGGLAIGFAYLGKTLTLLVLVLPFLEGIRILVTERRISGKCLLALAGVLAVWLAESAVYWKVTGDWLHHYNAEFLKTVRNKDLMMYPRLMFRLESWRGTYPYGIFFYFVVPGLLYAWRRAGNGGKAVAVWFLAIFLYHEFGSMSLSTYEPVDRQSRYLSIVVIPAVLLCAGFLMALIRSRRTFVRVAGWGGVVAATLLGAVQSVHAYMHDKGGVSDMKGIWQVIRGVDPGKPVFCDAGLIARMQFFEGYLKPHRQYVSLRENLDCEALQGAYVVFNGLDFLGERDLRPYFRDCLDGLTPVATIDVKRQLGVFRNYNPEIYYIPRAGDTSDRLSSITTGKTIRIPASQYQDARNCYLDEQVYGISGRGMIVPGPTEGQSVAFRFTVEEPGAYALLVRYAAAEPRPVSLTLDGAIIRQGALLDLSKGWNVADSILAKQKTLRLSQGAHTLVFSVAKGLFFPHIEEVVLRQEVDVKTPGNVEKPVPNNEAVSTQNTRGHNE